MSANLVSCLAMQLTLGVGGMIAADGVTGTPEVTVVETIAAHGDGQDHISRMKSDIELAGFLLTAEDWLAFDPDSRAQLISAASGC